MVFSFILFVKSPAFICAIFLGYRCIFDGAMMHYIHKNILAGIQMVKAIKNRLKVGRKVNQPIIMLIV